ncbi:hypothetical protein DVH24_007234 [Malus domestica]|uniref:Uncharacterized protein n=1 Tax=Malus domestica TaxID=3750 RepID=A0A498HET1_MALDO|nr:hypothetical protein DVH24_007234 [Malus domestica]
MNLSFSSGVIPSAEQSPTPHSAPRPGTDSIPVDPDRNPASAANRRRMAAEAAKETELWRRTRRRDVGAGEEELEQATTVEEWERAEGEEETMVLFGPQSRIRDNKQRDINLYLRLISTTEASNYFWRF